MLLQEKIKRSKSSNENDNTKNQHVYLNLLLKANHDLLV
jgi:hypothetical protein